VSARLPLLATAAAGVAGVAVSAYLTLLHSTPGAVVCGARGIVDCERVLGSGFSAVAGTSIPVAAAGLVWFPVGAGLALVRLTRTTSAALSRVQVLWSAAGLAVVLGLVFVEIVLLGALCAWCTVAHCLVLFMFLVAVADERWPLRR
jgi:uncharacterized membrane protein